MIFFVKNYNACTASENSSVRKTKQIKIMLLSNCAVCGKKKSTFIKNKEIHIFTISEIISLKKSLKHFY